MMTRLYALLCLLALASPVPSWSASRAVMGGAVFCVDACEPVFPFFELLCSGNCVSAMTTHDGTTFYGVDSSTPRFSTNGGVTWTDFLTLPATRTFSANPPAIGVADDGAVLLANSVISPGGCAVFRSTDGTASWSEVYFAAHDCRGSPNSTVLKCAGAACVLPYSDFSGRGQILESSNGGANWVIATGFAVVTGFGPASLYWDGTFGVAAINEDTMGLVGMLYTQAGLSNWLFSPWGFGVVVGCRPVGASALEPVYSICDFPSLQLANVAVNGDVTTITAVNLTTPAQQSVTFGSQVYIGGNISSGTCNFFRNGGGGSTIFTQPASCNSSAVIPFFDRGDLLTHGSLIYGTSGGSGPDARVFRLSP